MDSQTIPATQADLQSSGSAQLRPNFPPTQVDFTSQGSQVVPTQDAGFKDWTPLKQRFVEAPASTIATVINTSPGEDEDKSLESPLMQKRGRLRRKVVIASDSEDEAEQDGSISPPTAFNLMKDAAAREKRRKQQEAFDRKKSKAREMVHEQAEESEDEYAGLGGVDGEDSDDDDLASVQDMIDDKTQGDEREERKIAALHL
jgi:mediator of replication checkpoint protein 1